MTGPLRVIEFVGAPGSGKTTVADWLAGRSLRMVRSKWWVVPAASLRMPVREEWGGLARVMARPWVRAKAARWPWLSRIAMRPPVGHLMGIPAETERILSLVRAATVLGPRREAWYREEALEWLLTTVDLVAAALDASERLIPAITEGIVQRSLSVLGPRPEQATLCAMFSLIPPSTLLVHLRAPDEVVVGRALDRVRAGEAPLLHRGLTAQEIAALVLDDAAELFRRTQMLEADGRHVLWLDTFCAGRETSARLLGRAVLRGLAERSSDPLG